jgi:hypothetical protein
VKWFFLAALACTQISCSDTYMVTRRNLYSPDPAPDSFERQKEHAGKTRITTVTTTTTVPAPEEGPRPEFR